MKINEKAASGKKMKYYVCKNRFFIFDAYVTIDAGFVIRPVSGVMANITI
ncbi:MAG: hypothetical protein K2P76_11100 [Lachnospiraceae bacterium]|nr:hypothetical protein [Lachnospiraceae bacterium]MDE6981763.1 hypothetical protein [Lachnospiraceae bacterium]